MGKYYIQTNNCINNNNNNTNTNNDNNKHT